jgi:hypothetical protein
MTTTGDIDAALESLRARDPRTDQDADAALSALTAGEGFDHVNQHYLQYFLWYTLPKKFLTSLEAKLDIARALGEVLEAAGMPRYAAICRSDTTRECIEAAEEYGGGREEHERAQQASGVEPPDTDVLKWGSIMGMREAAANAGAASALELALTAGDLEPGASRWKIRQKDITSRWLTSPNPDFIGETPLAAIHAERVETWTRSRSDQRRAALERIVDRLDGEAGTPDGVAEALAPLTWFLSRAGAGIPLTERHNLGRAFVQEAAARWNWWDRPGQPMREDDVMSLWVLHEFARSLKLVRRRGRKLLATPAGRRCLEDAEELWHRVARGLMAERSFTNAVAELALVVLVLEGESRKDDIVATITPIVVEEGWGTGRDWDARVFVDEQDVTIAVYDLWRKAKPLGLMRDAGDWMNRSFSLTKVGVAAALEALWARATAPRYDVY